MAKKIFTDESLATFVDEVKSYTDNAVSGKANSSHNHAASNITSGTLSSDRLPTVPITKGGTGATTAAGALTNLGITATAAELNYVDGVTSNIQTQLDGKASSSHGTHVSYSTTAPVMDGTASVGSASTVARSDHKHPTDTSRASKTEFDTHVADTTKHITSTERTNWNAAKTHADSTHAPSNAEKNQNAFSNVKVGTTTIAADTTTDTLELVGSNVTITPDATNDKVTIAVADGSTSTKGIVQLTNSTSSTSTTTAATPNSVKSAYDLANTAKTNAATAQTRADNAYNLADSKVDSLSDLGITATATELNYVDGVTSNVQTQLDTLTSNKVSKTGDTMTGDLTIKANFGSVRFNDADGNKMSVLQANNDSHTTSIYAYPTDKSTYYEKYDFPTPSTGATANKVYKVLTTKDVTATVAELNYVDGVTSNIQTQLNSKSDSSHTHSSYVNQNAFSNIAVSGQTTVAADTATDTVTFAGSNMSITTNATTDTVTFSVADASTSAKGVVQLVDSATNTATDKAATANAVNTAYTLASKANTTANSAKTTAESKSTVEASSTNGNIKIDGTDITVYTHPTTAGNKHIPSGGSSGQVLKYSASGTATWGTDKDTTYSLSSGDNNGTIKITPSSGSAYNVAVKGLGSVAYTNTVPVANGGTGATTAAAARTNLGALGTGDVVDNLTSTSTNLPLSANQGKLLNEKFGGLTFGQDAEGNWGYIPSGADSVTPFSKGILELKAIGLVGTQQSNYFQQTYSYDDKISITASSGVITATINSAGKYRIIAFGALRGTNNQNASITVKGTAVVSGKYPSNIHFDESYDFAVGDTVKVKTASCSSSGGSNAMNLVIL